MKCVTEYGQDKGTFFGLFDGGYCICQGEFTEESFLSHGESEEDCDSPCWGNKELKCGGIKEMAVYEVDWVEPRNYERLGCYDNSGTAGIMENPSLTSDDMTPDVGIGKSS